MKIATLAIPLVFLLGLPLAGFAAGEQRQEGVQVTLSAEQLTSEQILELQRALQEHGIDPGPVDGILGPLTRQGIQLFQQQQDLATTGDLDQRTLEALGLPPQEFLGLASAQERQQERQTEPEAHLQVSLDQLNSAQVLRLQQQLQAEGIDPGPVDGIMGPLTRQGVQVFQQQEGLTATGNLNEPTLEALDIDTREFMGLSPAFE